MQQDDQTTRKKEKKEKAHRPHRVSAAEKAGGENFGRVPLFESPNYVCFNKEQNARCFIQQTQEVTNTWMQEGKETDLKEQAQARARVDKADPALTSCDMGTGGERMLVSSFF